MAATVKTDNGFEFPAAAYAYVPDAAEPSTWKIRLWADPETKVTRDQLGAAAAAMSAGGFRGEKADIPEADVERVKARIRSAYHDLGVKNEDMPESVRLSEGPQFIVSLGLLTLSEGSTPIPLLKVGTYFKGGKKFTLTAQDAGQIAENFAKRGNGEVVIDYEHASEYPEVAQGGPVPAAGWIVAINPEPDTNGVVWATAKLNERALSMIAAGEYKYGSPSIRWGQRDKSDGDPQGATLSSYALTNTPFLDGMPAIRLSDAAWSEKEEKKGDEPVAKAADVMCAEHPKTKMLCPKCDADEIKGLNASEHTHQGPKVIQLSEVKRDGKGRLDLSSLSNDAVVSFAVIQARDAERVALSEVQDAVSKGIVLPAQRDHFEKIALSDIETFRGLVKTMKPQVDLTEHGQGGSGAASEPKELEQIHLQLTERAKALVKEKGIPFSDAYKRASREKPELLRRRNVLTASMHGANDEGDDD